MVIVPASSLSVPGQCSGAFEGTSSRIVRPGSLVYDGMVSGVWMMCGV